MLSCARNFVGMADGLGATVIRFYHRVDRQRDAMGKQRVPAIRVKAAEGIPSFRKSPRQAPEDSPPTKTYHKGIANL